MGSAGNYIMQQKHTIIDIWEEEVNEKISASGITTSMVLRNLLPNLLEDLGQIIIYHEKGEEDQNNKNARR